MADKIRRQALTVQENEELAEVIRSTLAFTINPKKNIKTKMSRKMLGRKLLIN